MKKKFHSLSELSSSLSLLEAEDESTERDRRIVERQKNSGVELKKRISQDRETS